MLTADIEQSIVLFFNLGPVVVYKVVAASIYRWFKTQEGSLDVAIVHTS